SIVPAPRPVHGQTSAIAHDGSGFLAGLPQPFQATRYHSLIVDQQTLPLFLTVTATTDSQIPMGLRHVTQLTEGVQFHPESILTTYGQTIIRNSAQAIRRRPLGASGDASLRRLTAHPSVDVGDDARSVVGQPILTPAVCLPLPEPSQLAARW